MILLKWLVAGLTAVRLPTARLSVNNTAPSPPREALRASHPATSLEPMPPLGFAGALLTGLGALLLLHGGALGFRHRELPEADRKPIPARWEAVVRGVGGLAITAGLALASFISRREDA